MTTFERLAPVVAQVLAHAVEDDDLVVDAVADEREDRRDDVERQLVAGERQKRQRDQHVVNARRHRADAEAEVGSGRRCRP